MTEAVRALINDLRRRNVVWPEGAIRLRFYAGENVTFWASITVEEWLDVSKEEWLKTVAPELS